MRFAIALIVVGFAVFIWIRVKPPSLGFFEPRVREALQPIESWCQVRYDNIHLSWPKGRLTPGITITEARCLINGDIQLARFPEITMRLSLGQLVRGNIEPTEIWLTRPQLDLANTVHMEKLGGLDAKQMLDSVNRPEFFDDLFSFASRHTDFKRLHAANGRIILPGNPKPVEITLPNVVLSMLHAQQEPELIMTAAYVLDGQASRVQMVIHAPPAKGADLREVSESRISFTNLHPPILAELAPDLGPLRGLKMTADVEMLFRVTADGTIDNLRFDIESTSKGTLFHPDIWEAPIPVEKLTAKGWLKNNFTQLKLAALHIDSQETTFNVSGTVDHLGKFDSLSLDARVDHLNPAHAHRYWPYRLIPKTRLWIRNHFTDGDIHDAVAKIRISPKDLAAPILPAGVLDVKAPFKGVAMKYREGLEPIKEASGTAHFTAHGITIDVADARNYDTRASEGKVVIGNFTKSPITIAINTNAKGPADDLRKAVDGLMGNQDASVGITAGKAATRLSFHWPLSHFSEETFDYHAASNIEGLAVADFHGFRWEQKTLLVSLDRNIIAVSGKEGEISSEAELEKAIPIQKIEARAQLSYDPAGIEVTSFSADLGGPTLAFSGRVMAAEPSAAILLDATVEQLPVKTIHQHWPRTLAVPVRKWFRTHVPEGRIDHAGIKLDLEPAVSSSGELPKTAVAIDAAFSGVQIKATKSLPALKQGKGTLTASADTAAIKFSSGRVAGSKISAAQADITGIQTPAPTIDIQAEIEGPGADLASTATALLKKDEKTPKLPPLKEARAITRIEASLPLDEKTAGEKADYTVSSKIRGIHISDFYGFNLTDGSATAILKGGRLSVDGRITSGQTPVSIRYEKNTIGNEVIRLQAAIIPDHHADLRLPPLPFLSGSIPTTLEIIPTDSGLVMQSRFDFTEAAIRFKRWGWTKPAGIPAVLESRQTLTDGNTLAVSELVFAGDNLDIKGSGNIVFQDPTAFDFQFDPLNVAGHRLAVQAAFDPEKGYRIDINGSRFDAAGFFGPKKLSTDTSDPSSEKRFQGSGVINIDIGQALLAGGVKLNHPKGSFVWSDEKIRKAVIDGTFEKDAALHIALTTDQEPKKIIIQTEDAGALLNGIDLYSNIQGGTFLFDGRSENFLPTDKPVSGSIRIKNFLLVNAPGLVKLLSMASFVGAVGQLQRGGISFGNLEGDLAFNDSVLTLKNGRMEGISIAITAEGTSDIEKRMWNIRGVVIPVNILNQIIGVIPVFGKMIIGEGIIATDYSIKGPYNDPAVTIKPLTTLSVGFLRNVFKMFNLKPADTGAGIGEAREAPRSETPVNPSD